MRRLAELVLTLLLLAPATMCASAQALSEGHDTAQPDAAQLDEVVVTGVRAGPRLWKVVAGDHVLWILGTVDPLPGELQWYSQQVNEVLAGSQAVLLDDLSVSADAGLFAKVGLYLQWRRMQKNPDHRSLKQVLPASLYQRFVMLKQRYAKSSDMEELRPIIVAGRLYQAAVKQLGFTLRRAVADAVEKSARQHGLKPQSARLKVPQPRELLDSLNGISTDEEIRCLDATLTHLESDLNAMRELANAWALGDIERLRVMVNAENRTACWAVLSSVPRVEELTRQAQAEWFAAAEAALQHNHTTLALRGVRDLLDEAGMLAQFRARGYTVSSP